MVGTQTRARPSLGTKSTNAPRTGGASITFAVKLTHSDTSGGSYTDVTDGGFTTTTANTASRQKLYVNVTDIKRFVKVSLTVAGGTGTGALSVQGLASAKYG